MDPLQRSTPLSFAVGCGGSFTGKMGLKIRLPPREKVLVHRLPADPNGCDVDPTPKRRKLFHLPSSSSGTASHCSKALCPLQIQQENKKTVNKKSNNKKRRVAFEDTVHIKEIPNHRDYSNEIRNLLWTGLKEIQANALANELELQQERQAEFLFQVNAPMMVEAGGGKVGGTCGGEQLTKMPRLRRIAKVSSFRDLSMSMGVA